MKAFIKLHTIKSGWSIVYIKGSVIILKKKNQNFSLKLYFVLENSVVADEMLHNISDFY